MGQPGFEETQNIYIWPYLTEMISILGSGISYSALITPPWPIFSLPRNIVLVCRVDTILIPDLVTYESTLIILDTSIAALNNRVQEDTVNPYKPSVLFVGHRQTVQIRHSVVSHQGLHCLLTESSIIILMKMKNTTQQPLTLNAPIATKAVCFSRLLKCLRSLYGKQCGPRSDCSYSRSTLFASILNTSLMLGNYLQQTTSADNIFRCIFFLVLKGLKWKWTGSIDKGGEFH